MPALEPGSPPALETRSALGKPDLALSRSSLHCKQRCSPSWFPGSMHGRPHGPPGRLLEPAERSATQWPKHLTLVLLGASGEGVLAFSPIRSLQGFHSVRSAAGPDTELSPGELSSPCGLGSVGRWHSVQTSPYPRCSLACKWHISWWQARHVARARPLQEWHSPSEGGIVSASPPLGSGATPSMPWSTSPCSLSLWAPLGESGAA